ncbi:MAG TPA: hypothetical protein VGP47_07925, partial [Parachlamydiaceae bacterium]|nr:hypothetical protein [Parachlamydiaceae bacterium]
MAIPSFKFSPSSSAWKGAAVGIFIAAIILMLLSTVELLQNQASIGDAAIYFVGGLLITALTGAMLIFIWILFANFSLMTKWAIACFAVLVYSFFVPMLTSAGLLFIGILALTAFSLIGGSIWSLITNRSGSRTDKLTTLGFLFLGVFGLAGMAFWSYSTLAPLSLPPSMAGEKEIPVIPLKNPSLPGTFAVKTLSYGNGTNANRSEYGKDISIHTDSLFG